MRVGLYLPNWTGGLAPGRQPTWPELADTARRIDGAGFDAIWVADQFVQEFPDHPPIAFWESWTIATAVATVTRRATVGPLVASVGFRNPALLAAMAVALDEVSGGRAAIGLGAGFDEGEHRARGLPFERRVARLEGAAEILGDLLRDGTSDRVAGPFETHGATLAPRGPRPAGPPLVIGTISIGPRLMRIVARHADAWAAWLAFTDNSVAAIRPGLDALDAACAAADRDPATVGRIACLSVAAADTPFAFGPYDLGPIAIRGEPERIADAIAAFGEAGVDEVALYSFPLGSAAIDTLARVRELIR